MVEAVPSKNAVTINGQVISLEPQTAAPNASTGAFSLNLIPTSDVLDIGFHYLIKGYYLNPDGYGGSGFTRVDHFQQKIIVPTDGGSVGQLAVVDTSFGIAWQGSTPPTSSMLWLYIDPTYDPDRGLPLPVYTAPDGTTVEHGELVEWSV
jgi:hypothetical protein